MGIRAHLGDLTRPAAQYSLIATAILNHAKSSWLYGFALRHKLSALLSGELVNDSAWDRVVFTPARQRALGERLTKSLDRVVVTGGMERNSIRVIPCQLNRTTGTIKLQDVTDFRIALSIPTVHAHIEFVAAGPILASHPMDLQAFSVVETINLGAVAHTGPPVNNIEAKIINAGEYDLEHGRDALGEVCHGLSSQEAL